MPGTKQSESIREPYVWGSTDEQNNARRQREFKQRRNAEGLQRVAVWVPKERMDELRTIAARMREKRS